MLHDQLPFKGVFMTGCSLEPFTPDDILVFVIEAFDCHPQPATHQSNYIAYLEGFCHYHAGL